MKIDINPEKGQNLQSGAADAVSSVKEAVEPAGSHNVTSGGLTRDLWDKRDLLNSVSASWDSEDTAVISEEAKRGIVGDPRIAGDEAISGED